MYRLASNPNLQNQKRWRQAPIYFKGEGDSDPQVYYHRPPIMIDLFYLIMVHGKFRSEAERLLGWLLLLLNEATHLIYRPRKFILPTGEAIDSLGRPYDQNVSMDEDDLVIEKVSLSLVDDLTVGDVVNLFSLHEAKYRPFLTYRARIALDGPLVHAPTGTIINMPRLDGMARANSGDTNSRPNGRPTQGSPVKRPMPKHMRGSKNFKRDTE